ncbi:unnamed protein product [Mytilus edulis]|uniref:Uncharacterized protein n=1 Tax=Mytilus edulis TaxID=6550 RepID=A0A8S3Q5I4_MYTED|nr:unnamed protein product [Mytilus edulis]
MVSPCFFSITFKKLSGQQFEFPNPSIYTTIIGLLTYPDNSSNFKALDRLWLNDSTTDNEAENTYFAARHGYNSSFKSNKVTTKPYNAAVFNHCQLQNIHVILTEQGYSAVDVNTTLTKCKISMINKKADDFHMKFFHIDHLLQAIIKSSGSTTTFQTSTSCSSSI